MGAGRAQDSHAFALWLGVPEDLYRPAAQRGRYVPGLDGMRAVAILAVVAYHLGHMPSGNLGVDVFFVISGYLITHLLADEQRRNGAISLARFYWRRALRLLPSLFVVLVACLVVGSVVLPKAQVHDLWWSTLTVATYSANFRAIDSAHMPLLAHTWSLAVEEQFYVLWPLPFSWLAGRVRPRLLAAWVVGLALASTLWCGIEYAHGASFPRLSDLPDTHAMGLLLGCGIALMVRADGLTIPARFRRPLHIASYLSAALVVISFRVVPGDGAFPYVGGFLLVSASSGVVLVDQVSAGPSKLAVVLGHPLAVLVGRWSYSLYLVHLPVIQLLQRTSLSPMTQIPVALAASFVLAVALHLGVERPALRVGRRLRGDLRPPVSELVDPREGKAAPGAIRAGPDDN